MKLIGSDTLFWQGGLNVGARARKPVEQPPADQPPVAGPDEAIVVAGSQIILSVLANDTDPEGGALSLSGATAQNGTVVVNSDGTLTYTAPADFSGTDTVTYMVTDAAGNASEGTVTVQVFVLSVTEGTTEGEFVVEAAPGELLVTVVEDGQTTEYTIQTAELAEGPVSLRPPQISGTAEAGATLTVEPGLWASDEAQATLSVSWVWMRGDAPIEGATGTSYVIDGATDSGQALHVVETASASAGVRQAASAPVEVPSAPRATLWTPAAASSVSGWWDVSDTASLTVSGSSVSRIGSRIDGGVVLSATDPALGMTLVAADQNFRNKQVLVPRTDWATARTTSKKGYLAASAIDARSIFIVTSYMAGNASSYDDYSLLFGAHNGQYNQPRMMGDRGKASFIGSGLFADARARINGSDGLATLPIPGAVLYFEHGTTTNIQFIFNHYTGGSDRPWSGPIAEIVVLGTVPDQTLIDRMEGYLAHKWGFADLLPDTHPHKTTAPTA